MIEAEKLGIDDLDPETVVEFRSPPDDDAHQLLKETASRNTSELGHLRDVNSWLRARIAERAKALQQLQHRSTSRWEKLAQDCDLKLKPECLVALRELPEDEAFNIVDRVNKTANRMEIRDVSLYIKAQAEQCKQALSSLRWSSNNAAAKCAEEHGLRLSPECLVELQKLPEGDLLELIKETTHRKDLRDPSLWLKKLAGHRVRALQQLQRGGSTLATDRAGQLGIVVTAE